MCRISGVRGLHVATHQMQTANLLHARRWARKMCQQAAFGSFVVLFGKWPERAAARCYARRAMAPALTPSRIDG